MHKDHLCQEVALMLHKVYFFLFRHVYDSSHISLRLTFIVCLYAAQNVVMATHKTFEMHKENNRLTKLLICIGKKVSESKVAHKELVEVFKRANAAHQKTEAELTQLKLGLAEERIAA